MKADSLTIRRARPEDVPQITALAKQYELKRLSPEDAEKFGFLVSRFAEEDYTRFLQYADHFYVMTKTDELMGFLLAYSSNFIKPDEWLNMLIRARHPEPFVLIKQIAVHPHHQGQGVASHLYNYLFDQVRGRPLFTVIVIDPPNRRSIAFHERMGFHKVFEAIPPDGFPRGVWKREAVP